MGDAVAVLNAGSSSIKFSLFTVAAGELTLSVRGQVEALHAAPALKLCDASGRVLSQRRWPANAALAHADALDILLEALYTALGGNRLLAVGHRVVHGGGEFDRPVRVDDPVVSALERYIPLAPLHQPHNIAPMRTLLARAPGLAQVACFDTAFHATQPALAQAIALPRAVVAHGIRRYGFHGLSYESIATQLKERDPAAAQGRTIVLHLGNGASMCAMANCRSVATTMGFSTLDGLPMGTRCGSLGPGVMLFLMQELGMDERALEQLLYRESGLLGVSGISSDVRVLEASQAPEAKEAMALFVYRIGRELGSLAATLGGLDGIVFTGGIGENSRTVRAAVCRDAAWLGVELVPEANAGNDGRISSVGSRVAAWVIATDEEGVIARHAIGLLDLHAG